MEPRDLSLTVWFDGDCPLCARVARWIDAQPKLLPVACVPAQAAPGRGCPLGLDALLADVTVTCSDGAVYRGSNAWIIVLWALRRYRAWALHFAKPRWRPLANALFATVSGVAKWTKRRRGS